jgi:hypothetical protein
VPVALEASALVDAWDFLDMVAIGAVSAFVSERVDLLIVRVRPGRIPHGATSFVRIPR